MARLRSSLLDRVVRVRDAAFATFGVRAGLRWLCAPHAALGDIAPLGAAWLHAELAARVHTLLEEPHDAVRERDISVHQKELAMPPRLPPVTPVAGVDLDFRPASYYADASPLTAIVQNIAGTQRRAMARDFVDGDAAERLGDLDDALLADRVSDDTRDSLGAMHPSFMGGEYLPVRARGEVEIARIELASTTADVISLTARRQGDRWRYRMVDEYESAYQLRPASSRQLLSLRQLIGLLESAEGGLADTEGLGMVRFWVKRELDDEQEFDDAVSFVSVSSEVYLELEAYYDTYVAEWAAAEYPDQRLAESPDGEDDSH